MRKHATPQAAGLIVLLVLAAPVAADWKQFRGPGGQGISDEKDLPAKWSSTDNVVWKVELPGPGSSCPVVAKDRVYLTAYTDSETLRRAKITEPFGYIVKPFDERELHSAIEMALYGHKTETKLRQSEQWLAAILRSTGDGVIAASKAGLVVSMNPVAEELTGWTQEAAVGREVTAVFQIIRQETREPAENPAMEVLRGGAGVTLTKGFCLVSRNGKEKPVDCRAIPVRDDQEALTGVFVVLRELAPGAP